MKQNQDQERPIVANLSYEVRKTLKVSWSEFVLLDMVYHLSVKHGHCYKSYSSIAMDIGVTFTGIKKMIARLEARELLIVVDNGLQCGAGYIDCAYLQKNGTTRKSEQSSERKTTKKHVPVSKTELSSNNEGDEVIKSELSSNKVNLVHKIELSSDEINSKNNKETISSTNVELADKPPMSEKDELAVLYYRVIKALGLPTRNHNNLKAKIAELHTEIPHWEAMEYLNFMLNHYREISWEFKPSVAEALDIHAKRVQIKSTFEDARKKQQKNQPVRFGSKR